MVGARLAGATDNGALTASAWLAEVVACVSKVGGARVACATKVLDVALGTAEELNVVELEEGRTGENLRNYPLEVEVERRSSEASHVNIEPERTRVRDSLATEVLVGCNLEEVRASLVEESDNEGSALRATSSGHIVGNTVVERSKH